MEDKYLTNPLNQENLIKLDSFKKKIFAIGIEEDFLRENKEMKED